MRLDDGRTSQKARTRQDLLTAARRVMERGDPVTVVATANEAGVSRATAYRYFPTSRALAVEIVPDCTAPPPEEIVGDAQDVRERVLRVRRHLFDLARMSEPGLRRVPARTTDRPRAAGGRARNAVRGGLPSLYEHALSPARTRMARRHFEFLVLALSAASVKECYWALKNTYRVDDALVDRIGASTVEAILDRLLPTRDRPSRPGSIGRSCKRLE